MWVLMYVFSYSVSPAATDDKAEWRLLPTVVFQEFSNEKRCRTAKSTLETGAQILHAQELHGAIIEVGKEVDRPPRRYPPEEFLEVRRRVKVHVMVEHDISRTRKTHCHAF